MKRILALLLTCSLALFGCTLQNNGLEETPSAEENASLATTFSSKYQVEEPNKDQVYFLNTNLTFTDLSDPDLLKYVEDVVYSDLVYRLNNETYFVENVSALYISNEYLEESAYNLKENIYFGFTLSELEEQFAGTKFIFTLGNDGQTKVQEFEEFDDTYEQVIKNAATGFGVILLCVTVSVVTAVAGAPAVSMIFAASAKTGAIFALSSGVFSACAAGVVNGIATKDFDQAVKSSALAGSDSFKWGAISGTIIGGASGAIALKGATLNGLTMNEAAAIQKESRYPLDVIKQFKTRKEYEIFKEIGLKPTIVNGQTALVREINLDYTDELGHTNLVRMKEGLPALNPVNGESYELHHIGQQMDSTLAILTKSEHIMDGNHGILHEIKKASEIYRPDFIKQRKEFWKALAEKITMGGT